MCERYRRSKQSWIGRVPGCDRALAVLDNPMESPLAQEKGPLTTTEQNWPDLSTCAMLSHWLGAVWRECGFDSSAVAGAEGPPLGAVSLKYILQLNSSFL